MSRRTEFIRNGEPVSAGTPNRPLMQLAAQIEQISDRLNASQIGATLYARDVTVEAAALVGMPVYFDADTNTFKRAIAIVENDNTTDVLELSPAADIWGLVASKSNDTVADLLLYGYCELDIANAVEGDVLAGTYYLSTQTAGYLTRQRPSVAVPVLRSSGNGRILFQPQSVDILNSHRHHKFSLYCRPAGTVTPPSFGQSHEITSADAELPGWLPADHASFNGNAPAGAAFGYNLEAHASLKSMWPPVPISNAYLEWQRTDPDYGGQSVPTGDRGLVVFDRNGIWWMSDCYGDVPWPVNYDSGNSASDSDPGPLECPRDVEMALTLWFTSINFMSDLTAVTSLQSLDSRLKIYCAGTENPAHVGHLVLDLDLELTLGGTTNRDHFAIKTLDGQTLERGPVLMGLYTESDLVSLTSSYQTRVDPEDPASAVLHHGLVRINVTPDTLRELAVQVVHLQGTREEYLPVLHLGLLADRASSFVSRVDIPAEAAADSELVYRMRLLGRTVGTMPQLTVSYKIVSRPTNGLLTPVTVLGDYVALSIDTDAVIATANTSVEANSEAIIVQPGDIVYFKVERDPTDIADTYAGLVGVMQQLGILTTV